VSLWPMIHNLFNKVPAIFNIFSWMNANLLSRFNHGCTQTYFQYFLADVLYPSTLMSTSTNGTLVQKFLSNRCLDILILWFLWFAAYPFLRICQLSDG